MGILFGLLREMRYWDRASKFALGIALVLLVISLTVLSTQPDLRTPALIGTVGLLIAIQVIILWGNRRMVTPYTEAQRHFIAGEFEQVLAVLEASLRENENEGKKPSVKELVLLGNTYRNLGQVEESAKLLNMALERTPNSPFALYGLGKTQLSAGDYDAAIEAIEIALENGAPPIVGFDLAHAYYRMNDGKSTLEILQRLPTVNETYRQIFVAYLQYRLADATHPTAEQISAGLPFWEAEVERFAHTPYGQALQEDVEGLRQLL